MELVTFKQKTFKRKLLNRHFVIKILTSFFISASFLSCTKDPVDNGGGKDPLIARIIKDTSYGADPLQKLDIFLPAGRTAATKIVFLIHGGGWESGSKSDGEYVQVFNQIKLKWPEVAVVSINYRLTSKSNIHYQEIMSDVSAAVNFIVNNKNTFITSDTVCMMGASAGAHLAMMYTYKYNTNNYVKCVADFFGPTILNDLEWYNSYNFWLGRAVKDLLIQFNGAVWNQDLYGSNSPYTVATNQSKPTIIFHGTLDAIVPIYQSQWFRGKLNSLGVVNEYYEYLDGHGFNPSNTGDALDKSISFFKRNLK